MIMGLVLTLLLKSLVVLAICRLLPGLKVAGWGSALGVAVVYGLLTALAKPVLVALTLPVYLPLYLLSVGLISLVLNGFFLWVTDKLLTGFKIASFSSLALATLAMSAGDVVIRAIVR